MPFSTAGKNNALDNVGITHVSAHTAAPNDSGSNEVTGGSYARQSLTFSAAASGSKASSNSPVIPIPASTTITHLGFWTASTSGTFLGFADITDETFGAAGTYTVTSVTLSLT